MALKILVEDIQKTRCDAVVNSINAVSSPEESAATITQSNSPNCKFTIQISMPVEKNGAFGKVTNLNLKSYYINCLTLAKENGCRSVAFPLLGSDVSDYPKETALNCAIQGISEFLFDNEMDVYLCIRDKSEYALNENTISELKAFLEDSFEQNVEPLLKCQTFANNLDDEESSNGFGKKSPTNASRKKSCKRVTQSVECEMLAPPMALDLSLEEYLKQRDKSFMETLYEYIDASGMTDVQCYKRANIDRKTFSKLKNNPAQRPSKRTAVALAIALELSYEDTQHLLETAGMTLSKSVIFDEIIRYFIEKNNYDIWEINEALLEFDQEILGSI